MNWVLFLIVGALVGAIITILLIIKSVSKSGDIESSKPVYMEFPATFILNTEEIAQNLRQAQQLGMDPAKQELQKEAGKVYVLVNGNSPVYTFHKTTDGKTFITGPLISNVVDYSIDEFIDIMCNVWDIAKGKI